MRCLPGRQWAPTPALNQGAELGRSHAPGREGAKAGPRQPVDRPRRHLGAGAMLAPFPVPWRARHARAPIARNGSHLG